MFSVSWNGAAGLKMAEQHTVRAGPQNGGDGQRTRKVWTTASGRRPASDAPPHPGGGPAHTGRCAVVGEMSVRVWEVGCRSACQHVVSVCKQNPLAGVKPEKRSGNSGSAEKKNLGRSLPEIVCQVKNVRHPTSNSALLTFWNAIKSAALPTAREKVPLWRPSGPRHALTQSTDQGCRTPHTSAPGSRSPSGSSGAGGWGSPADRSGTPGPRRRRLAGGEPAASSLASSSWGGHRNAKPSARRSNARWERATAQGALPLLQPAKAQWLSHCTTAGRWRRRRRPWPMSLVWTARWCSPLAESDCSAIKAPFSPIWQNSLKGQHRSDCPCPRGKMAARFPKSNRN